MKPKDLAFRLKAYLLQKFRRQYFKDGGEKSFTTYLWSKVDVQYRTVKLILIFQNSLTCARFVHLVPPGGIFQQNTSFLFSKLWVVKLYCVFQLN